MSTLLRILAAATLLLATTGATIATHFCGGQAVSTRIAVPVAHAPPCGCPADAPMPADCCNDDIEFLRVTHPFALSAFAGLPALPVPTSIAIPGTPFKMNALTTLHTLSLARNTGPPGLPTSSLMVLYQQFLL